MKRALVVLVLAAVVGACGGSTPAEESPADTTRDWAAIERTPEPGFDPADPTLETIPEDDAHAQLLIKRAGTRKDFKIPRDMAEGLDLGPLVLAVVLRPFQEADDTVMRHMNAGQRAVYAMYLADFEILNGGFSQLWENVSPEVTAELVKAAQRVGSPEFEGIFRDAQALMDGGDADEVADLDQRYAATQYHRKTALGVVLGTYIRAHLDEFVAE
jgi:hypothetical protein